MTWVDRCVYNQLNDIYNGPRCAAIIQLDGSMHIYLYGGEYVKYDPKKDIIILLDEYKLQGKAEINEWTIDVDLIRSLYKKITKPSDVSKENEDLNLGKVRQNTEAGQELIKKYRDAFTKSKTD